MLFGCEGSTRPVVVNVWHWPKCVCGTTTHACDSEILLRLKSRAPRVLRACPVQPDMSIRNTNTGFGSSLRASSDYQMIRLEGPSNVMRGHSLELYESYLMDMVAYDDQLGAYFETHPSSDQSEFPDFPEFEGWLLCTSGVPLGR